MTNTEQILKEFDAEFYESHSWVEINDHIAIALETQKQHILDAVEKEIEKRQCRCMCRTNEILTELKEIIKNL